jgi:hypothetical protein
MVRWCIRRSMHHANENTHPALRRDLLVFGLLLLLGAFVYLQAHRRALDPIIDTGRDLYVASEIAGGAVLYRDYAYNYPPVAPYLLAGWVVLFGNSLASFATFGALTGGLTLMALFALARRVAGTLGAGAAGLLFVSLNFAGASTWGANYIFPFAYAATVGMLFCLLSIFFLLRARPLLRHEAAAVGFALLACWSKLEYALAMAAVFAAAVALRRLSTGGSILSLSIFASAGAVILLSRTVVTGESAGAFYATVSGADTLFRGAGLALLGASGIALFVLLLRNVHRGGLWPVLLAIGLALLTWVLAGDLFFRGWSVLQIAVLAWAIRERKTDLVLLSLFAIAALVRIPLNAVPGWYGFTLIIPLYVVIVRLLFREAPAARLYAARAAWLWLPLLGLIAASGILQQRERYALKEHPIRTPRGVFFDVNPDRARILTEFIALAGEAPPRSLMVIPEGVSLNYFTGVKTPLRRYIFTPPETEPFLVEEEVLEQMMKSRPEMIVLLSRDLREFGSAGFGTDYNQRLLAWIRGQYTLARSWRGERFELLALRVTDGN